MVNDKEMKAFLKIKNREKKLELFLKWAKEQNVS